MSDRVTLRLRKPRGEALEVEGVTADRLATLDERVIATLPVWLGSQQARLGDFFDVQGGRSDRVHIEGDLTRVDGLAAGNAGGEVVIDGHAGRRVAAGMRAGRVEVHGSVGDDAGIGMAGGVLRITGNAGDRLGASMPGASKGMTGGEIVVDGSAGADVAARARRGLVVVAGNVGDDAARAIIAGTLIVFGNAGSNPGRGSKRGSIVSLGRIAVPDTYIYACTFEPPYVRLTMTYLRRRYGFKVEERAVSGRYRRYCGDAGDPGKGEILVLV